MNADKPVLCLLDLDFDEYENLYSVNEKLFRSVNNWFYFANDEKLSALATKGYVRYGRNRARKKSLTFPDDGSGALVLICRSRDIDMKALNEKCAERKNGIVTFELNDGTPAHYGIIIDNAGVWGPVGGEYPLLVVSNKPQMKDWPYSKNGNTVFAEAVKEGGTLSNFVASGKMEELLPDRVKHDLKIPRS